MRLYIDGQLEGIRLQGGEKTEWSCHAQRNVEAPNGDALELVLPAAGVVDELRVSKCLRFGPFVPEGAKNTSLVVEQDASKSLQATAGGMHLETSDKDLNAARLKVISKVPDVQAAHVFNASQAKPAWEGMAGMKLTKDCFGAGADGVELDGNQESDRPSTIYWKLTDIEPGKYYLGLWQETQGKQWDWPPTDPRICEYWPEKLLTCAVSQRFPRAVLDTSEPVQVKPGVWLTELQTGGAIELKPGDEVAVRAINADCRILAAGVVSRDRPRGHGATGQTFGSTFSCADPFPSCAWESRPRSPVRRRRARNTRSASRSSIRSPTPPRRSWTGNWPTTSASPSWRSPKGFVLNPMPRRRSSTLHGGRLRASLSVGRQDAACRWIPAADPTPASRWSN